MILETKFDLGQYVFAISKRHAKTWIPCSFCAETGQIKGADEASRVCPECYGRRGEDEWLPQSWQVLRDELALTVGRVEVKVMEHSREERYMMHETGVGSGQVFDADNLFAKLRDAKSACRKRNATDSVTPSHGAEGPPALERAE